MGEAHFYNLDGDEIEKQTTEIKWNAEAAEKAGFEHFMMKEIHEQPKAVKDTLGSVIKDNCIDLSSVELTEDEILGFDQIYIVACGSAWHVGMAAQYVIEDLADIPVRVELASEFRYRRMSLNKNSLVIVISQSGETADTLAALRLAKEKGIITLAVVNVVGSSIAREADKVFYTLAGPEISVATTKAYSAQFVAMYCLAVQFAKVKNMITEEQYSNYLSALLTILEKIQKILQDMGFTVVPFGQGFKDMSPPTKEFYKLLMEGRIIHGGNPVMAWMAGNVVVDTDPAGNIKPTKAKSPEKIDGIVAAIMALDRCIRNEGQQQGSVYDERDMIVF